MKIVKLKKDKSNTYTIYFNNYETIKLYDDVIIKYNLLAEKNVDELKLNEIVNYNKLLDLYYKSIKYINKKLRTELEIKKFLEKNNCNNIDYIVELLYKQGYLNQDNYIISFINDQYNLTLNGPIKINRELIKIGCEKDYINKYLYTKDWNSRIDRIIEKKLKINSKMSNIALKNKIINDIINLGYEKKDISDRINNYKFVNDYAVLKKELVKIKSKYSKKYLEKELKFKVCNYLFGKGFNIDDIKRCYDEI